MGGFREREIASADEEVFECGGSEGPAFGGNFDGLPLWIGEVEDEFVVRSGDAAGDGFGHASFGQRAGFEHG